MTADIAWLERYSVVIVPALAVLEQLGIPVPAVPALLATGALAASGRVSLWLVIVSIVVVTLPIDLVWHEAGRRRGAQMLSGLCRFTLETDVCVRRAENLFIRHGVRALLVAKFLPGLTTVVPPLAGAFGVSRRQFVIYDLVGSILWAGTWMGVGFAFSNTIELVIARVASLGRLAVLVIGAALVTYVGLKYLRRWIFLRRLRIARITAEELRAKLDAAEDVAIMDLRTTLDVSAVPYVIPGSRWVPAEHLDERLLDIPRNREWVLYCSCPNEATSARVALRLRRRGVTRVRPLDGGMTRWMSLGFPVEPVAAPAMAALETSRS
jgi:membrane protein DedA with SNARE-associated domain/rhodanese-related sulfurtransferase